MTRCAGTRGYHRLRDTALGLVVGEFVSVGLWLIIDGLTGTTGHRVFPVWKPS